MGMRCRSHTTFQLCFFFNDTATTEIYTLSLHDALPISEALRIAAKLDDRGPQYYVLDALGWLAASSGQARLAAQLLGAAERSEEHTSELQSQSNLVCRLLLEKKNKQLQYRYTIVMQSIY